MYGIFDDVIAISKAWKSIKYKTVPVYVQTNKRTDGRTWFLFLIQTPERERGGKGEGENIGWELFCSPTIDADNYAVFASPDIYMHIHIHVYVYTTHAHTHARAHVCTCVRAHTHTRAHTVRARTHLSHLPPRLRHLVTDGGQQFKDEYAARNPMCEVPSLAIDGATLTQSLAIIDYIDETRSERSLMPSDPLGRAKVTLMTRLL